MARPKGHLRGQATGPVGPPRCPFCASTDVDTDAWTCRSCGTSALRPAFFDQKRLVGTKQTRGFDASKTGMAAGWTGKAWRRGR